MRARTTFALAFAAVAVFAVAAVASAAGVLTLTASATKVTYPHRATLTVGFPSADPSTATILALPVGASEWVTTTLQATTATPTVRVRPTVTTAYKAWLSDGSLSEPVTVSVAARLSRPQINGNVRRGRSYVVKGTMQPTEALATVTVGTYRMETTSVKRGKGHAKRVEAWVLHTQYQVPLKAQNSITSKWSMKWRPLEKGWWKVVVSHVDATHIVSSATTYKWVR